MILSLILYDSSGFLSIEELRIIILQIYPII